MASCQSDAKQSHTNCSKTASQRHGLQACTGIEDFGIALHHLEEANWVLMDAVNRAIPQDGGGGVDPVAEGGGSPPRIVGPLLPQRGSPPPDMEGVVAAPSMPQLLPSSPPRLHTAIQVSFNDEPAAQENRIRYLSGQYKCSNGAFRILQQQYGRPWWAHVL